MSLPWNHPHSVFVIKIVCALLFLPRISARLTLITANGKTAWLPRSPRSFRTVINIIIYYYLDWLVGSYFIMILLLFFLGLRSSSPTNVLSWNKNNAIMISTTQLAVMSSRIMDLRMILLSTFYWLLNSTTYWWWPLDRLTRDVIIIIIKTLNCNDGPILQTVARGLSAIHFKEPENVSTGHRFRCTRNAIILRLFSPVRHVLIRIINLCRLQQWPFSDRIQLFRRNLLQKTRICKQNSS